MSGQTFRENIEQEVNYLFDQRFGRVWPPRFGEAFSAVVDWAVERFEAERDWAVSDTDRPGQ